MVRSLAGSGVTELVQMLEKCGDRADCGWYTDGKFIVLESFHGCLLQYRYYTRKNL